MYYFLKIVLILVLSSVWEGKMKERGSMCVCVQAADNPLGDGPGPHVNQIVQVKSCQPLGWFVVKIKLPACDLRQLYITYTKWLYLGQEWEDPL